MGQNEGCYSVARIFLSALFFVQWLSLSRCQSCGGSGEPCFFVLIAEQAAQVLPLPSGEGVLPYKSALNDCLCCASKYRLSNTRFFFFFVFGGQLFMKSLTSICSSCSIFVFN